MVKPSDPYKITLQDLVNRYFLTFLAFLLSGKSLFALSKYHSNSFIVFLFYDVLQHNTSVNHEDTSPTKSRLAIESGGSG